jgi:deoxyribodipyrimidine photolyase-related protein
MTLTLHPNEGIPGQTRHLIVILGDQLDQGSPALGGLDPGQDLVWMCEAVEESTHVPTHKARLVLFLSAMRHFRDRLGELGLPVRYRALETQSDPTLAAGLTADLMALRPNRVILTRPGEHRVMEDLVATCKACGVELEVREDSHFISSIDDFRRWAKPRKTLVLEHFYRSLRRREGILMDGKKPVGELWSLDRQNRKTFGRKGPGLVPAPLCFPPDATTQEVMELVQARFPGAPGRLDGFDWPVTRDQALAALDDFIDNRLPSFGPYQDAMWTGAPYLYHSRLSAALNLKLLNPREVIEAALGAMVQRELPLASIEGFVRQILGWREYVRGVYWTEGPEYLSRNALEAHQPLPRLYWDAQTPAACLAAALDQVLEHGYGHHIQRLMVTGLFALLLGVKPQAVHAWYLGMYVDAVEWVEAPNTLGMSQYADGGRLASKPYVASGAYIRRMSNYCDHCPYDPKVATGPRACPFTTLYWDFLARHRSRFGRHPRTALQWRQLDRLGATELSAVRQAADDLRRSLS